MLRGLLVTILYMGMLIVILFGSAGRWDWVMGWVVLGGYALSSLITYALAEKELVIERSRIKPGVDHCDARIATISFVLFYPITLAISGLDFGRFAWSPTFPDAVKWSSVAIYHFGNIFGCWAVLTNRYFSTFMRIQDDRAHRVIKRGPYQYVRHPGYAGTILSAIALPFALGSIPALVPAIAGSVGFIIRTSREDEILINQLDGYKVYVEAVRYRLIPGIW